MGHVLLDKHEARRLRELARRFGLPPADVVKLLIRQAKFDEAVAGDTEGARCEK